MIARPLLVAAALMPFLSGAACEKKSSGKTDPAGAVTALDKVSAPVDKTALPGIDVAKLPAKSQDLFYKLVGTLTSPCGKAHSLRTSVSSDTECKRAPFAARYVAALIEDEAPEDVVREQYETKYKKAAGAAKTFQLDGVPHSGPTDAPVVLVEFFDYGCPSCQAAHPVLEEVMSKAGTSAVIYYKQYPLVGKHPDSMSAAQAALAADKQGKFKEMHGVLFENSPLHKKESVLTYAQKLGLDLPTFEADYAAAEARVKAEMAEGDAVGVDHTPTLFFAGREYEGPMMAKYLGMWIEEEVAVNR
ncbi:MAG: thioredoxin domain-containing protein [Kofleriaceae bacterium]|nr:thioredoxin domain-containing protein [Kofleriaceae bacterium]MBP6839863.1 thioredoxin domain-containing protein [Kofleriaceae bacterium]MBP9205678.1 thioredoxin domain-containing protein [Kofleriaceae bacterium]